MNIHQLVACFRSHDAISNEARVMQKIFNGWGHSSNIYSELRSVPPDQHKYVLEASAHRADFGPDDIAILHLSIGSPVNVLFRELPCKKVILYHNITPPHFFSGYQERVARIAENGLKQVKALANCADLNWADSKFNASEMEAMGYKDIKILPLILDLKQSTAQIDKKRLEKYSDGKTNILFVGRCAPNKKLEDLLACFYYFQKYVEPNSRLIHVGSHAGMEGYHALILTLIRELGIENIEMTGEVSQAELNACFKASHAFVCMSDHEGFCIPLLEAMNQRLPVLAAKAGAIEETMDGAGLFFQDKRYDLIAETLGKLKADPDFYDAVLRTQDARMDRFRARDTEQELRDLLAPLL